MKKETAKRVLALLICVLMAVSMLPTVAMAEEVMDDTIDGSTETYTTYENEDDSDVAALDDEDDSDSSSGIPIEDEKPNTDIKIIPSDANALVLMDVGAQFPKGVPGQVVKIVLPLAVNKEYLPSEKYMLRNINIYPDVPADTSVSNWPFELIYASDVQHLKDMSYNSTAEVWYEFKISEFASQGRYAVPFKVNATVWREDAVNGTTITEDVTFKITAYVTVTDNGNMSGVKTDRNVGTFTMPKSNVTVTAEFESTSEITPTITSVALVKSADGSLVVNGVPSGDNWTITIPNTVSAETVAKIPEGLSGLNLKIETPTGVTVKQMDGGGSYEGDWSKGDIMCWMPVNEEVSFRAIAGTATKDYTIKLVYAGSPLLSDGSATRSSKTAATVTFTSNVAGTYYYKVVDHDAAAPTVDEIKKSTSGLANAGTATTFTISNLTGDARDVYIVVVAASGESAPLKIEIPDYDPNPGEYTITVNTPKGGTIIPNRTSANAGDEIIGHRNAR